uniref:Uncharacterized protein n=1 Tax=Varanus komodoensis TaxID=61221 RepID=A0A8D2IH76_VARKO
MHGGGRYHDNYAQTLFLAHQLLLVFVFLMCIPRQFFLLPMQPRETKRLDTPDVYRNVAYLLLVKKMAIKQPVPPPSAVLAEISQNLDMHIVGMS